MSAQRAGAVVELLSEQEDLDSFLASIPVPEISERNVMETQRSVCMASLVDEKEVVCQPKRRRGGKRAPRMRE